MDYPKKPNYLREGADDATEVAASEAITAGAIPPRKEPGTTSRINIQDAFLNHCRREREIVNITLINSQVCTGIIVGFDNMVIALEREGRQVLVYKTGIILIAPDDHVNYIFNEAFKSDAYRHGILHTRTEHPHHFS